MAIYTDWAGARNGGPAARTVARYNDVMQQLADKSRQPGFSRDQWTALEEVVATGEFKRFGNFLEEQDWQQYVEMLNTWAPRSKAFSTNFLRMTEHGDLVFLELEEFHDSGKIRSVSIYELNDAGKIARLHIYLQAARGT